MEFGTVAGGGGAAPDLFYKAAVKLEGTFDGTENVVVTLDEVAIAVDTTNAPHDEAFNGAPGEYDDSVWNRANVPVGTFDLNGAGALEMNRYTTILGQISWYCKQTGRGLPLK